MVGSRLTSKTCPPPPSSSVVGVAVAGSLTFKHLIGIIALVCTVVTLVLCLSLCITHLRRYTVPNEQRQILRIIVVPAVFSIFGVISVHSYSAGPYLTPLANLYEAWALVSLFLLFVNYVAPDPLSRATFFDSYANATKQGQVKPGGSLRWFERIWRTIFLYPVVYAILVIATIASLAAGTYCATSMSVHFAHVWCQVLMIVSVIIAVLAMIRYYRRLKPEMIAHRPLRKFMSFKAIVFIETLQNFIFSILRSKSTGGSTVTYNDLTIGVPACLICIEQVFFAAFFFYSFPAKEYLPGKVEAVTLGLGRAVIDALNPTDLFRGVISAFRYFRKGSR